MERANEQAFEHSLTMYLKAKRDFRLCEDDVEPSPHTFGISEWLGAQIKKRIERELNRKF